MRRVHVHADVPEEDEAFRNLERLVGGQPYLK